MAVVVVDEAAEYLPPFYGPSTWPARQRHRTLLAQPLMRATFVVILYVFFQYSVQMLLVYDEQVIQALLSSRANPAFGDPVRLRTPGRSTRDREPLTAKHGVEPQRVLAVAVVDQDADRQRSVLQLPTQVT